MKELRLGQIVKWNYSAHGGCWDNVGAMITDGKPRKISTLHHDTIDNTYVVGFKDMPTLWYRAEMFDLVENDTICNLEYIIRLGGACGRLNCSVCPIRRYCSDGNEVCLHEAKKLLSALIKDKDMLKTEVEEMVLGEDIEISCDGKHWEKRTFVAYIKNSPNPYLCVSQGFKLTETSCCYVGWQKGRNIANKPLSKPYENAQKLESMHLKTIIKKNTSKTYKIVAFTYDNKIITVDYENCGKTLSLQEIFDNYTWLDGTVCGITE